MKRSGSHVWAKGQRWQTDDEQGSLLALECVLSQKLEDEMTQEGQEEEWRRVGLPALSEDYTCERQACAKSSLL